MLSFIIVCHVWLLHTALIVCTENSTECFLRVFTSQSVVRFSVPEDHQVRLQCGSSHSSDVVWTHQDREVPVTRQGIDSTIEDGERFLLLSDGSLRLLQLEDSDSGEYRCNQQLVAELQVLTGHHFTVSAGRTLLLPCSRSFKAKQRWFHRRKGGKREAIFTRFRNGTVRPERGGGRLSYDNDALQIQDLQPEDAGEYQCNTGLQVRVTVLAVKPEPTNIQQTTSTTTAAMKTDVVEFDEKKTTPENALLIAAVVGLGLMIVLMAAVCVLLISMKCKSERKYRRAAASQSHADTELRTWKTSSRQTECADYENPALPEETIHYASLGRHNWRERPCRTSPDQNHHNVIYSSVITRPAAK